ncbi:MAG: bifunctional precorrin-2 dehydrogenase/sirohydrochlorin ferrochelatase [Nitrospirales bacterium]|nr:bifunctional precorrin-2 dehydrogenase/sirohydrochlorin ferrochelatase [Nitrospira sp.]MDR4502868.1 bifunctional precorrin-2 dehydrogenase/sirohydrochlorin ferrochelatase [Nitrospirales bacterium]
MDSNVGFQISLNIQGRSCLVLGGEEEAVEKIDRILESGGKVTVVNPTLHTTLRKYTASGKIIHRGRTFRTTDVQNGVAVVVNTVVNDHELAKQLYELAKTERFLVWSIDQPDLSTITMPALVKRGPVRVAISTSGASPSLAKAMRKDLEILLDEEFGECVEWLGAVRNEMRKTESNEKVRRKRLQQLIEGFRLTGTIEYPRAWQEQQMSQQVKEA